MGRSTHDLLTWLICINAVIFLSCTKIYWHNVINFGEDGDFLLAIEPPYQLRQESRGVKWR